MNVAKFSTLSLRQKRVMLMSLVQRNELEDFHVAHLTDAQMKTLNQTMRYSLYRADELLEQAGTDPSQAETLRWLIESIPDYWEIPGSDPGPEEG